MPAFSQSKASFSAMPRSFMLFSNTDMINCRGEGVGGQRGDPGASQEEGTVAGTARGREGPSRTGVGQEEALEGEGHIDFK